jgi:hypothetical protein
MKVCYGCLQGLIASMGLKCGGFEGRSVTSGKALHL